MTAIIELRGVGRTFGVGRAVVALQAVDLAVSAGESVAVTGRSGSGKSTLLALMGLLDAPTVGQVLVGGQDVTGMTDRQRSRLRADAIGFVFQQFHLVPYLTAVGNVDLALRYRGLSRARRRARVWAALAAVGLSGRLEHRPDQLSGGEQQRVAIARALVTDPMLVLADEPTGNLDSASADLVMDVLAGVVTDSRALVLITHDTRVAARAGRHLPLRDGRIATRGEA